jgi:hypothetical protein
MNKAGENKKGNKWNTLTSIHIKENGSDPKCTDDSYGGPGVCWLVWLMQGAFRLTVAGRFSVMSHYFVGFIIL